MKHVDRIKQTGEVFTPRSLVREMLSALPNEVWFDPNKRWLEPSAGDGNFLVEVKARLLQAGHSERHILENMLFSVELIDDNHWVLQHRLGYLVDGNPNPKFWPNGENFEIAKIHPIAQDLNNKNPYHDNLGLEKDEVLHHRNHVCTTALEYDMSFGRSEDVKFNLPVLEERDLGEWPETDTPDIGEKYVVEQMLGTQPQLQQEIKAQVTKVKTPKEPSPKKEKISREPSNTKGGGWGVHFDNYGKGLTVRTKSPIDGIFYVADHDELVDKINESLLAAGKIPIGPDKKSFGASSGVRSGGLFKPENV